MIQTEDELTGLHMLLGASLGGNRVLSTSSGPGFALFHEGMSYLCGCEIPAVLVDVQRLGAACGGIGVSQGDYEEVVHGGGNGDSQCIVLTPASVQEEVDLVQEAYDLAEKYRNPVIVMTDAIIGQMMEGVTLPDFKEHDINKYDWVYRPLKTNEMGKINAGWPGRSWTEQAKHLREKFASMQQNEQRWENVQVSDADVDAEIEKMAANYGMEADKLKEYMGDAEKDSMKKELAITKAVDLVMANVKERAKAKSKKEKEAEAEAEA